MVKSKRRKIDDLIIAVICLFFILICLLPLVNILARSFSSPMALTTGRVSFFPVGFTWESYIYVFNDKAFIRSLIWTAVLTLICTLVSLTITILCAYPLIYNLKGKKFINVILLITMYFNAGLIPNYLLMKQLDFLDKPVVLIIPGCLSIFNMIILRSFFYNVPESLREAAQIDGAGPFTILIKVYLPMSKPVLATLALYYAVGRWNGFSDALMYITKTPQYHPIQLKLYQIINNLSAIDTAQQEGFTAPTVSEGLKAASVMFATVPILLVYPRLQKYFIKGTTLGAIKE